MKLIRKLVEEVQERITIHPGGESGPLVVASGEGFSPIIRIRGRRGRIRFRDWSGDVRQSFGIGSTRQTGVAPSDRLWLVCRRCKGRCQTLYVRAGVLACRRCHGLAYLSARVAHRRERLMKRVERAGGLTGVSDVALGSLLRLIALERRIESLKGKSK